MACSISSTHRMAGAMDSAVRRAWRMFISLEPMKRSKMRLTSKRRSGRPHRLANALAVRLLPQPWTPRMRTPLGRGSP